jgi:hypothetical protein
MPNKLAVFLAAALMGVIFIALVAFLISDAAS